MWPEVDGDTRLDLRAYSDDDSNDSVLDDDGLQSGFAELADIPYEQQEPVQTSIGSEETTPSSPSDIAETFLVELSTSPQTCALEPLPLHPPLSTLPTIPSLDSSSPEPVKAWLAETETSLSEHLGIVSGRSSAPLRRRQVVHDLRKAFELATVTANCHSTRPPALAAPRERHCSSSKIKAQAKHAHAGSPLSFEHQITIALLATMGTRSNLKGASVASLQCTGRAVGGEGARQHSASRAQQKSAVRWKMRSLLRKLKGFVFSI